MKKFNYYLKEFRSLLHFFPLMRFIFRYLWTMFLLFCTQRLFDIEHKLTKLYWRLSIKNMEQPLFLEYLAYYKSKRKKKRWEIFLEAEIEAENSIKREEQDDSMKTKLIRLMESKRLYMNYSLTIDDISRELATNRTYLSKEIKQAFKTGFRDYLNRLRIEKAKELMRNCEFEEISLIAISEQAGFRNYSTFNAAFKKEYRITPGEWKLQNS